MADFSNVKTVRHFISAFWLLTITGLSALPGVTFREPRYNFFGTDKIGHACLYFFLTRSLLKSSGREKTDLTVLLLTPGAALGWGGLMEMMQTLPVVNRSADWRDMLANLAGGLLALGLFSAGNMLSRRDSVPCR